MGFSSIFLVATGLAHVQGQFVIQTSAHEEPTNLNISPCNPQHYVALGDSYAAGIRADPASELPICDGSNGGDSGPYCTTSTCAKNYGSYPWMIHKLHQETGTRFDFFACSGADTESCLSLQVPKIKNSSDLVTINIGGNNKNAFSKVITRCVYFPKKIGCKGAIKNAQNSIETIEPDLSALLKAIKKVAPSARIAIMSYVKFWPKTDTPSQCQSANLKRPSSDQKATMNTMVEDMNKILTSVAKQLEVDFIDADPLFENHRLCDVEPPYIQWSLRKRGQFDDIPDGDDDGVDDPDADLPINYGVFHPYKNGSETYIKALSDRYGCRWSSNEQIKKIEL